MTQVEKMPIVGDAMPIVTVIVLTYNHESFIGQCLDSVLMQRGDFLLDLLFVDDCSSDATRSIIRERIKSIKGLDNIRNLKFLENIKNLGVVRNLQYALDSVSNDCDFLTFCEGDDFWLTPDRLTTHILALNSSPGSSFSFNDLLLCDVKGDNLRSHPDQISLRRSKFSGTDLAACNFIGNFSACFYRFKYVKELPKNFFDIYCVDWAFNLFFSQFGSILRVNKNLSVYRQHQGGEWSSKNEVDKSIKLIGLIVEYDKVFLGKYSRGFSLFIENMRGYINSRYKVDIGAMVPANALELSRSDFSIFGENVSENCPKVSVLIPMYNHADTVGKAVASVLEQGFDDFELLISDDCSSDSSVKVARDFIYDSRVKIYAQHKNLGPVENLHFLISQARAPLIAILNSDDYWLPDKLQKQFEYMSKNLSVACCFTWAEIIDGSQGGEVKTEEAAWKKVFYQKNRPRPEWLRYLFDHGNCFCHPSVLIRKYVYSELSGYNPYLRQLPDYEFWLRVIKKYEIGILETVLVHHVRTGVNTSIVTPSNSIRGVNEFEYIYDCFFDGMSDVDFISGFSDLFRVKRVDGKYPPEVLEIEKAFLLFDSGACRVSARNVSLRRLASLANIKVSMDRLASEYVFASRQFHAFSGSSGLGMSLGPGIVKKVRMIALFKCSFSYLIKHGAFAFARKVLNVIRRMRLVYE